LDGVLSNPWKAGFTDGDGLLTIVEHTRSDRPSVQYFPYAAFSLTSPSPLKLLIREYGGKIYAKRVPEEARDKPWAPQWLWRCPSSSCERFLRDVLPYLRMKRPQALILLELAERMKHPLRQKRVGRGGSAPLTAEELSARRELRHRVRVLNTKGIYSRKSRIKAGQLNVTVGGIEVKANPTSRLSVNTNILQWMAGFFDAEGSFAIEMQIRKNRPSPRFTLKIAVSNSNKAAMKPFVASYRGRICLREETRSDSEGRKWSDMFLWNCPQGSALSFLNGIMNFLVVKRPQAILARRFLEHVSKAAVLDRSQDGTFGRLKTKEIAARGDFYREMLRLNSANFELSSRGGGDSWPLLFTSMV
jgi:hypothetical protein